VGEDEARARVEAAVESGAALEAYERWIRAQGGDPDLDALPRAPVVRPVEAARAGSVTSLSAMGVGLAALRLGAGRRTKEDAIDHAVGVVCHAKRGATVEVDETLAEVHARTEADADEAALAVAAAYTLGDEAPEARGIVLGVIR